MRIATEEVVDGMQPLRLSFLTEMNTGSFLDTYLTANEHDGTNRVDSEVQNILFDPRAFIVAHQVTISSS